MSYKKEKVKVLSPKEGYDKIAKIYKKYHSKLDRRDNLLWQRFLPRNLKWLKILDIWAGDCRLSKYFKDKRIDEYVAFDISHEMLNQCKSWVKKVIWDINNPWLFENWYFDLELAFFVLLYVKDLDHFFAEASRTLKPTWNLILLHHRERRPQIYKVNWEEFKIDYTNWRFEDIEKAAEGNFLKYDFVEIPNWGGRVYNFYL